MLLIFAVFLLACSNATQETALEVQSTELEPNDSLNSLKEDPLFCNESVQVGAEITDQYLTLLENKSIAVVGNQSSLIQEVHLVDSLVSLKVEVVKVFSPEHGFRGEADAGEKVVDGVDSKTGIPITSLYGKHKKPTPEDLEGIEVILFDLQDAGVRFYTYISTLTYVLEAAAENEVEVIILDRPNPNGHYVDGPTLKEGFDSFIGMHEIPVVHGMTVGEYGTMVNEEGWLEGGVRCNLKVVSVQGWDHTKYYEVPIKPSPNLPNAKSIYLYPSLCFFEGTVVSIGRGTDFPFQVAGHPDFEVDVLADLFSFTPKPNDGAKNPKLKNEICYGYDFQNLEEDFLRSDFKLNLSYLFEFYEALGLGKDFFLENNFIDLLYGSDALRKGMISGKTLDEIESSWESDITTFKKIRKKHLLYEDFE